MNAEEQAHVSLLADTELYDTAVSFVEQHGTLSGRGALEGRGQLHRLQQLSQDRTPEALESFVRHQRDRAPEGSTRDWWEALGRQLREVGQHSVVGAVVEARVDLTKAERRALEASVKQALMEPFVRHMVAEALLQGATNGD